MKQQMLAPIRGWRKQRRWSLDRAARHFGVHPVTYWRWETYRVTPRDAKLRRVARALRQRVAEVEADYAARAAAGTGRRA